MPSGSVPWKTLAVVGNQRWEAQRAAVATALARETEEGAGGRLLEAQAVRASAARVVVRREAGLEVTGGVGRCGGRLR
jgi:hypothetical protein